jgi:hypothetical protein
MSEFKLESQYAWLVKRVLVAGAGGPASEGVINSLNQTGGKFEVIGIGSDASDLVLSSAKRRYLVPRASDSMYWTELQRILEREQPELLHAQNDNEVLEISKHRDQLQKIGVKTYLPEHSTIETCVDKWKSYTAFSNAGIRVPRNIMINDVNDLKEAFSSLTGSNTQIWLRANVIGGGGIGALPTSDFGLAKKWIEHHRGWSNFLAAEMLTKNTVTWMSIWYEGNLIVAQTRARGGWVHGNRTLSGVTGVTKVGRTISDPTVTRIAQESIFAVDKKPHGIFSVDMAYDENETPNPTEINIGRFFTTVLFFTKAGVNFPEIYADIILESKFPSLKKTINPLEDNLFWFRGMDSSPKLLSEQEYLREFM